MGARAQITSPPRIAVNGYFWDLEATGSGQYVRHLVKALREVIDLKIEVLRPDPRSFSLLGESAISNKIRKLVWEQYSFPRGARRMGAMLCHVPYFAPSLIPRVPQIVTVHDIANIVLPEYRGSLWLRLYFLLARGGLRRAVHVITDSEAAKLEILGMLRIPQERVTVVPLGVDPGLRPLPADSDELKPTLSKFGLRRSYFLYLGGFDARKNLVTLVEAYAQLVALGIDWDLVMAGDLPKVWGTPIVPDLPSVIRRHGLDRRVVLTGKVAQEERLHLYSAAGAFVFPSSYEGFGLPPLEAMACGVPVIVGSAPALKEVCGEAAIFVSPRSVPELVQAMHRVAVDSELRRALISKGLERARVFSWINTAKKTAELYIALAKTHAGYPG